MALVTSVEGTQVPLPSAPDAVQRHRQDGDGHSATRPPTAPSAPLIWVRITPAE